MDVTTQSDQLLEFRHDGTKSAQPMIWIVVACVAAVALAFLFGGSIFSLTVVLVVGAFFVMMLRRSSAESSAVFDRADGTVTIVHKRGDTEIERTEIPFAEIGRVIVEASSRSGRPDNVLTLRPALQVGTSIVPLTWRAFVSGDYAIKSALAIRRFLGQPEDDLFEDSVSMLSRYSGRVNPAVRIARLGLGLGRADAATLVTRLQKSE